LVQRLPRETGRDYAIRTLKDNIIRLDLAPGSLVSENELSVEMGLSRTPVREALIELSKVGIVEVYPQRGSGIALIDYGLVEEACFMRLVLEKAVVELDCSLAVPDDIKRLEQNLELYDFYTGHGDSDALLETDNEFHHILFQIARKERVFSLTQNMSIHFDRVRRMSLTAVKDQKILQDHRDIANAIARRDPEAASALMELHLNRYKIDKMDILRAYPGYFKN